MTFKITQPNYRGELMRILNVNLLNYSFTITLLYPLFLLDAYRFCFNVRLPSELVENHETYCNLFTIQIDQFNVFKRLVTVSLLTLNFHNLYSRYHLNDV